MNSDIMENNLEYLYQAILSLKNEEECKRFFSDLCTPPELKAMGQRLYVASLLDDGRVYSDIVQQSGASTAIVSRVKRSMMYGENGYHIVFERIKKK